MIQKKTIGLAVVLLAIVGAIFFLQAQHTPIKNADAQELYVEDLGTSTEENSTNTISSAREAIIAEKADAYPRAVELVSPDGYINSEPFNLADYIGKKVILVDFWTYSCINCQRTLPYLQNWWKSYEDDGLLIVGVHTPEFSFEKDYANVKRATQQFGVTWPVVQDNDQLTFRAYNNHYWPRKYLIDIDGFIIYDHIGEGGYAETEEKIVDLLNERKTVLGLEDSVEATKEEVSADTPDFSQIRTPELYLGYGHQPYALGNAQSIITRSPITFALPESFMPNRFYFNGTWTIQEEYAQASNGSGVALLYSAKKVNIVAGSPVPVAVDVYVDGMLVNTITVSDQTLYTVANLPTYGAQELFLLAHGPLQIYTYTFG